MIVSKYLIGKFLPKIHEVDDQHFIDACSAIGVEVESIHHHPKTNNLVIGQILKVSPHPNADKLNVCEVKIDNTDKVNTIVCGAPNVKEKKKVIVALNGAKLHDGRVIEYKELRGILSQGMICSYGELTPYSNFQTDEDAKGIVLLDDAIVGDKEIEKYLNLNDTIYDLSVPSNRNDLNGVLPLCQDLSGFFKWDYTLPTINEFKGTFKDEFQLKYDQQICNGIAVIKIKDIPKGESSWLLKGLLMNNGVKPLNSTLDKLAYVTLLTNISTAVYDVNKIGTNLNAILANENEEFVGFDKRTYRLNTNDIVIKSDNKIVGLAGILGSIEHGMSNTTKDICIEIANFNYVNIRTTSIRLDILTDAAKRFSKENAIYLNNLTLQLINEQFTGFQVSYPIVNFKTQVKNKINVDYDFINKIIGVKLQPDIIQQNLKYYGFQFENNTCILPLNRIDMTSTQDIAEEVVKFINVNDLPIVAINGEINTTQENKDYELLSKVKQLLNSNYFSEVKTYNLTSENDLNSFNVFKYAKYVKIENAHNVARTYLRTNLIHALLKVYQYNDSYKTKLQPIFEIQKIYANNATHLNLTMINNNTIHLDRISGSKIVMNINALKGIANDIAKLLNTEFEYFVTSESNVFYNNELLAIQCNGQLIGYIGSIKASKLNDYDLLNEQIYCLTINLETLLQIYHKPIIRFTSVNNLMPIYKDISFAIHPLEKITNLLTELKNLDFVESYEFIDRYIINDELTSYTLRFRFNNIKGLSSKTIDGYLNEIEKKIIENHANIRK